MKYGNLKFQFDWTEAKDFSLDNQWKSLIEILWNSGLPFLSAVMIITYSEPYYMLLWAISAFLHLEIKRKTITKSR